MVFRWNFINTNSIHYVRLSPCTLCVYKLIQIDAFVHFNYRMSRPVRLRLRVRVRVIPRKLVANKIMRKSPNIMALSNPITIS